MKVGKIQILLLVILISFPLFTLGQKVQLSSVRPLKADWFVQSSAKLSQDGAALSRSAVPVTGWYRTTVPSTVMGVLTRNGLYPDLFMGDHYRNLDKKQFDDSWWYRKEFKTGVIRPGEQVTLNFDGLNYYANIWLNGRQIASRDTVYGPYRRYSFDITKLLSAKENVLAVEVFRAQPGDFNLGFVDWNPRPADENMGIWRGVYLRFTGQVSLENPVVRSTVNLTSLTEADLTIRTGLTNHSSQPFSGFLKGELEGKIFHYPVQLKLGEKLALTLNPEQVPDLHILNPRLWWCNNLGSPELYQLILSVETKNQVTDKQQITFGIREIESYVNDEGHKGFKLNGRKVLIKGAGWSDDIFLRDSVESLETQVKYARHMNLNTLRFESIWGNSQEIYDLCDKYGLLAMVGWSCQWEWDEYLGKTCDDFGGISTEKEMQLAVNSLRDQVLWLRNHPSVFVWLVGSDKCPRPELEERYARLLGEIDNRPYLSAAGTRKSSFSGPTGVKMNGPYEYVSPNYWYVDTINGGAFGFNTETGPGPQVPLPESLKKMIPSDKLWPLNDSWNYHCTHSIQAFNTMEVFNKALENRFGKASTLDDYLMKSDVQSYEAMKAMFEAFRVNIPKTTGIIQWMLNSAWPSLYWQLYDYYLLPTASYYAARKANAPVQLIYDYGKNAVYAVNELQVDVKNLRAEVKLLDLNSNILSSSSIDLNLESNHSRQLLKLDTITQTVFIDLRLFDSSGRQIADNFYWVDEKPDVPAWDKTYWAYTPMKEYTDFSGLNSLPAFNIELTSTTVEEGKDLVVNAQLVNPTGKTAFFVSLAVTGSDGNQIRPLFWEDNYISLLPGEHRTLTCRIPKTSVKDRLTLGLSGWNVSPKSVEIR